MKNEKLYTDIKWLIAQAKSFVVQNINTTLVFTNYHIGRIIVKNEQKGKKRAAYADKTLKNLSEKLTKDFVKGYSERNLRAFRQFYLLYENRNIWQSLVAKSEQMTSAQPMITQFSKLFKLSWTHYMFLMRIETEEERNFYEIETANNNWSVRELQRQYNSSLYERLALSKDKKKVKELSRKGQIIAQPLDMLKEPYVLEFLELKEESVYTETELETALINKLEHLNNETRLPLERRLIETAVWFHRNKDRIPRENLEKRIDFLEKTLDIFLEMTAMLVDRAQLVEGRAKSESLWIPRGIDASGDFTKFG